LFAWNVPTNRLASWALDWILCTRQPISAALVTVEFDFVFCGCGHC
jgi:hypothetical protein